MTEMIRTRAAVVVALAVLSLLAAACGTADSDPVSATTEQAVASEVAGEVADDDTTDQADEADGGDDEAPDEEAPDDAGSAPVPAGEVVTGPGVDEDTIRLGAIADLTGPFAAASTLASQTISFYWDRVNADGGVCGRQVEYEVRDHAYNPQTAAAMYQQLRDDVAALQIVLGAQMVDLLAEDLDNDDMLTVTISPSSTLLEIPEVVVLQATYDVEAINGVDYLVAEGLLGEGDVLGHVHLQNEYGENALLGTTFAAQHHGLTLVAEAIQPTEADLTNRVATLRQREVDAIVATVTPRQAASLAAVAAAQGLDVPVVLPGNAFDPGTLDSPAGDALQANAYVVTATAPYYSDLPAVVDAREYLRQVAPDRPEHPLTLLTWGLALGMHGVLDAACAAGDLSRAGIVEARRQLSDLDSGGILVPLDLSRVGDSPTRTNVISQPDASVAASLRAVEEAFVGEAATAYTPPHAS